MNIVELSIKQIYLVSGGCEQPNSREVRRHLGGRITNIRISDEGLERCLVPVICGRDCVTRCIPEQKPEECSYEEWGRLHDIDEGTIQKCKYIPESKLIK